MQCQTTYNKNKFIMVTSVLLAGANRAALMADSGDGPGCGGFEEVPANGVMGVLCWMWDTSTWQWMAIGGGHHGVGLHGNSNFHPGLWTVTVHISEYELLLNILLLLWASFDFAKLDMVY